jgi:signal transduction histidine kinase
VISAQEEERKRIGRGLHDETMQQLSVLLMKLDTFNINKEHRPGAGVDQMRELVINTLAGIRNIIQNLRPSILDDLGLEAAIRWLLDRHLMGKGISCFINMSGGESGMRFDPGIEITLFRIIQEAIVNIARHSGAENVFVVLKADFNSVAVDIEDDGTGFDTSLAMTQTEDGRGLGILGMKERAGLIEGELKVCSSPGCGTRISLKIPI